MGAAPRDREPPAVGPTLAGWGLPGIASARGLAGWEGPPGARWVRGVGTPTGTSATREHPGPWGGEAFGTGETLEREDGAG